MSAYETLQDALDTAQNGCVLVRQIDLLEILSEVQSLRAGGVTVPASKYTPEFEAAWSAYPARPGASKAATFKAWKARLKSGATVQQMIEGAAAYAAYCKAKGTEPEFIKQPATFYGPGEHYAADWKVRKAVAPLVRSGPAPESVEQKEARRTRWGLNGLLPGDDQEPIHAPY